MAKIKHDVCDGAEIVEFNHGLGNVLEDGEFGLEKI
jgi:hypothetical protein